MLDVMVVRPRFVAWKPRRKRLGRLRPVDDGDRNQRKADEDGEPDEKTAALHDAEAYGFPSPVGEFAAATLSTRHRSPASVQYETATLGPPFRSPSRFHFRPPAPLTFGFRLLPSVPASTYLRSVLGANRNLGEGGSFRKRSES